MAAGNVLSRLLGFVREPVIAAIFGATGAADAFEVATRIPNMIFEVMIGGAVAAVLVPVFTGLEEDRPASSELFFTLLLVLGIVLAAMTAVLVLLAGPLVTIVAAGFSPQTHDLAVAMLRITLPAVLLLGLSAIASGRLYAAGRFVFPAFSVSALNGTFIAGALALTPLVGPPGVALGYLAGAAAHLAIQIPGLIQAKVGPARPRPFSNPELRKAVILYAPVLAGLVFAQVINVIDTRLAAASGEGSLAMMRYATRLQQFPLGILVAAMSIASLPALARAAPERFAALPQADEFKRVLSFSARYLLLLMVPATVLMIGLAEPLTRAVYERGEFAATATGPTAMALVIYSIQLPLVALDQLFIFAYYSARNTATPVLVGVAGGLVYLAVALPLVAPMGFHGLVWANTAQNSLHGLAMGVLLCRALRSGPNRVLTGFALRLAAATGIMVAGLLAGRWASGYVPSPADGALTTITVAGLVAVSAYLGGLWLFRVQEARLAISALVARVRAGRTAGESA